MPQMTNSHEDVRDVSPELVGFMEDRGWSLTEAAAVEISEELKGEALDEALKDAGLARTGSADEKRARFAEYIASTTDPAEEQS